MSERINRICAGFSNSSYFIGAAGFRDVNGEEFVDVIKIIISGKDIREKLNKLYLNHPDTIEMDRSWNEDNCDSYSPVCDCHLPGIEFDNCYCEKEKRKRIETSDRRNYPEYKEWRMSVFERDGYTCQNCGVKGGKLNAHHKLSYKNFPELRVEITNGVTLCESCHRESHKNEN